MEENGACTVWFLVVDDALDDGVLMRVEPREKGGGRGEGEDDNDATDEEDICPEISPGALRRHSVLQKVER
jgi:hypothetical protein